MASASEFAVLRQWVLEKEAYASINDMQNGNTFIEVREKNRNIVRIGRLKLYTKAPI